MAVDTTYQSDLRVNFPSGNQTKCKLSLSSTGDLQFVSGKEKLVTQMLHAIVSDDSFNGKFLNLKSSQARTLNTLVVTILKTFRDVQINYIEESNPNLTGFCIWRKASGSDDSFSRVSGNGVTWKFTDSSVINGTAYTYAVSRIERNVFESKYVDIVDVTPVPSAIQSIMVFGNYSLFIPENNAVTVYVNYNKRFMGSEVIDSIEDVSAEQDQADPRKWTVTVQIRTVKNELVTVSSIQYVAGGSL